MHVPPQLSTSLHSFLLYAPYNPKGRTRKRFLTGTEGGGVNTYMADGTCVFVHMPFGLLTREEGCSLSPIWPVSHFVLFNTERMSPFFS
mmetsp:Transcript_17383/g.35306  ORF Transcript_17383/g.35306 Transcript_17383/m.35306 type:complete len:89 (-) Transcript_17383:997-1263(-)